jgi:hypothetical protein
MVEVTTGRLFYICVDWLCGLESAGVPEDYGWGACLRGAPFLSIQDKPPAGHLSLEENNKTTRRKHQNNTPKTSKQHAKTSKTTRDVLRKQR